MEDNSAAVLALLKAGADVDGPWEPVPGWQFTPLFFAKSATVARTLLSRNADVNARDYKRESPMHIAARFGRTTVVKALVEAGADPKARNEDGRTALHEAARNGALETVEVLLKAGGDPTVSDEEGLTAFHWAALRDESGDVVKRLLEREEVELEQRTGFGETPLQLAARGNENPEVLKLLLEAGANADVRMEDGRTLLHQAAWHNENTEVLRLLLALGADPTALNENGFIPLHFAALGNEDADVLARLLAQDGVDLEQRTGFGETPLQLAARGNENPEVLKLLLDAGADDDIRTEDRPHAPPSSGAIQQPRRAPVPARQRGRAKSPRQQRRHSIAAALFGTATAK